MATDRTDGNKLFGREGQSCMDKKELELYVHIPFCVKKCAYCDFLSFPSGESEARERASYVDALLREIKGQKDNFKDYVVTTVFLGGGTPSLLRESDTARIFHALKESFDISGNAEITMEVNPGTVTAKKAAAWRMCGVNRLSIGLQSANDDELKILGRIHTFQDFLGTWKIIREAGFDNVNIDLISAIPGQTLPSWEKTLRAAAELGAEHLSAYSLIIEEGTPFYKIYGEGETQNKDDSSDGKESTALSHCAACLPIPSLPDEDTEREIYKVTKGILEEYGYHRYEISNYAKEGYECRHNLGYWERKEYLGLGLGASSLINEQRFRNTADMGRYLEVFKTDGAAEEGLFGADGGVAAFPCAGKEDIEMLSVQEQMEEFMFLGLRKMKGVSRTGFQKRFGKTLEEVYLNQIKKLERQGLVESAGDDLWLTERGIDVSNYVFAEFLL